MAMSASTERGKHARADFPPPRLVSPQAACDLGHQGLGDIQGLQGLREGLDRMLGLRALVLETRLGVESTALSGLGVFVGVAFDGGQSVLLQTVLLAMHG